MIEESSDHGIKLAGNCNQSEIGVEDGRGSEVYNADDGDEYDGGESDKIPKNHDMQGLIPSE